MKIRLKKKQAILLMLFVSALIAAYSIFFGGQNLYEGKTEKVKIGKIQNTLKETGTVFSKRINTFYSDMNQRVKTVNVYVGDKVKKGDIILTYENDYDLEIEKANKQLEAITATYNETVNGADFKKISDTKLNISIIENNLNLARDRFEEIKKLYEKNAVSNNEYSEAENNVADLENKLQEAKDSYDLLMQGVSSNIRKQYEDQTEGIIVQIKMLEQNIEKASIKAEFDGVITELNVHQGSMTQIGVPVVEIQDEKSLGIYVEVSAEDAAKAINGMPFIISTISETKELKIDRICSKNKENIPDMGIEEDRVRIEADLGKGTKMKIGAKVDAVVVLEEKSDVLLVDKDAVYEKDNKEYVTVIEGRKQVENEITTGIKNNKYVEVTSGLSENETVLIEQ